MRSSPFARDRTGRRPDAPARCLRPYSRERRSHRNHRGSAQARPGGALPSPLWTHCGLRARKSPLLFETEGGSCAGQALVGADGFEPPTSAL
jgi:hypothetical protein